MVKIETRDLGMHRNLLLQTIKRQAGTLDKANLEGIMNSIEAGATKVKIELVEDGETAFLSIIDNGQGIDTKENMIKYFETFGTPHDESENVIWKQFRMGRGQMFAFGKNVWRTSTFKMEVDIDNKDLTYKLTEGLEDYKGCQIEIDLYKNPIGRFPYYKMESYKESILRQVAFVDIPVFFNGEQVNNSPKNCQWDFEDDNAYYLFNVGYELKIYNLGVFVMSQPSCDAGMGGIVVSKKQLKVNFARNDIQHDCPIYEHINKIIKENRIKRTRKARRTLDCYQRQAILKDLRNGQQKYKDIKNLGLIQTAQGKYISLETIRKNRQQWCFADIGDNYADKLMEREQALCISDTILHQLNYAGVKNVFFSWLVDEKKEKWDTRETGWDKVAALYCSYKNLSDGISDEYVTFPDKKLTSIERRILKILNSYRCWDGRVISIGYSDRANGWTDGISYICIDRSFLNRLYFGYGEGTNKLMMLLTHEMGHDDKTNCTHYHGPEFYENIVNILNSDNSPTVFNAMFYRNVEKAKIQEKKWTETAKQGKAKERLEKKLGIAASVKKG